MRSGRLLLSLLIISLIVSTAYMSTTYTFLTTHTSKHRVINVTLVRNPSLSLRSICKFLSSQFVRLNTNSGCLRESPITEPNTCYISTNWLCMHVLEHLCGYDELANAVREFLEGFIIDFYDYYQVLLGKPFPLPITVVKHVNVSLDNTDRAKIVIKSLVRTDRVYEDYDEYTNLIIYKAILALRYGNYEEAINEVMKLEKLFDGIGFKDLSYKSLRRYETYKLALAIYLYRLLGPDYDDDVRRYEKLINSIKPFATLYDERLNGVGDLNIETACLTAIALYGFKDG